MSLIPLKPMSATLYFRDGTSESFTIEAPNDVGGNSFLYTIKDIQKSSYQDGLKLKRRGYRREEVSIELNYSSHGMDLKKLLLSEYIDIDFGDFPVLFTTRSFVLDTDSITKNWFESMVVTQDGETEEESNPIPSGKLTLKLISKDATELVGYPTKIALHAQGEQSAIISSKIVYKFQGLEATATVEAIIATRPIYHWSSIIATVNAQDDLAMQVQNIEYSSIISNVYAEPDLDTERTYKGFSSIISEVEASGDLSIHKFPIVHSSIIGEVIATASLSRQKRIVKNSSIISSVTAVPNLTKTAL